MFTHVSINLDPYHYPQDKSWRPITDWRCDHGQHLLYAKSDGNIQICGDYKLTVNQAARVDTYPLPEVEELFASLAGGTKFSKLDLAHAYQQVCLDESSKHFTTINTHHGLFVYNRLPFGVSSAPAISSENCQFIVTRYPQRSYLSWWHCDNRRKWQRAFTKPGSSVDETQWCRFTFENVIYVSFSRVFGPSDWWPRPSSYTG